MSIPYPRNFDDNLDEERHERRYALAVRMMDLGDIIAEVESQVAQITNPAQHPLAGVIGYYLESGGPHTGRLPWCLDALAQTYDRLVKQALDRLIEAKLGDVGAWEVD